MRVKENELEKEIEQAKLSLNAAGDEMSLPSPECQATTAMPLRISRTPLQLGTIPSGVAILWTPHFGSCVSHSMASSILFEK